MIEINEGESRLKYLSRVLERYMDEYAGLGGTVDYDGTDCDGFCLAQDFANAIEDLPEGPIETSVKITVSTSPIGLPDFEAKMREAVEKIFKDPNNDKT